jgi:hypothetical protein
MGDQYEHDDPKPYFTLVFVFDERKGVTKLALKGPKVPGTEESPEIGLTRKGNKFVLKIGVGEYTVEGNQMSDQLRAFFGEVSRTGVSHPTPVTLPSRNDLKRPDGTYMNWSTYDYKAGDQAIRAGTTSNGPKSAWPKMPEALYNYLVRYYRHLDMIREGAPLYL